CRIDVFIDAVHRNKIVRKWGLRMLKRPGCVERCARALFHDFALGRTPGQMLSAIYGKCDPCDVFCLRQIDHGSRDVVRHRTTLKRQVPSLDSELHIGLARAWQCRPRRYRVYPNPWCQRLRQSSRGRMQRRFAQGVGEKARSRPEYALVKNVDDRGIEAGGRLRGESLSEE